MLNLCITVVTLGVHLEQKVLNSHSMAAKQSTNYSYTAMSEMELTEHIYIVVTPVNVIIW